MFIPILFAIIWRADTTVELRLLLMNDRMNATIQRWAESTGNTVRVEFTFAEEKISQDMFDDALGLYDGALLTLSSIGKLVAYDMLYDYKEDLRYVLQFLTSLLACNPDIKGLMMQCISIKTLPQLSAI